MTVESLFGDLLLLAVFMLIGFFTREVIKPLQKFFLPSSLIGGFLLLILGPQMLNLITVPSSFESMPSILIDAILACVVFGVDLNKDKISSYMDYSCVTMTTYGLQMGLGVFLGWILTKFWPGLPEGWGVMGVFSLHGGHGTAAAAATSFEKIGIEGNMAVGMVLSTFGLLVAMAVGMVMVNYGIRKGWGTYVKETKKQPAYFYGGSIPEEERKPVGHQVTTGISINHLALQISWILAAVFLGKVLFQFFGLFLPFMNYLPSVLKGILGGCILWQLLKMTGLTGFVDLKTIKIISGFLLEIVIFTAMATLDLKFVSTYIVPISIYTVILTLVTIPAIFYLSWRFCKKEWFEKACMAFGAATGNTSTGLALLRSMDPDSQSEAGDTHGVYSTLMCWKDIFVGMTPLWLAGGIGLTMGVGFAMAGGFALIGFLVFDRRKRKSK